MSVVMFGSGSFLGKDASEKYLEEKGKEILKEDLTSERELYEYVL